MQRGTAGAMESLPLQKWATQEGCGFGILDVEGKLVLGKPRILSMKPFPRTERSRIWLELRKQEWGETETSEERSQIGWSCLLFNPSRDPVPGSACGLFLVFSPVTQHSNWDPVLCEWDQLSTGHFLALPSIPAPVSPTLTSPDPTGPTPPIQQGVVREIGQVGWTQVESQSRDLASPYTLPLHWTPTLKLRAHIHYLKALGPGQAWVTVTFQSEQRAAEGGATGPKTWSWVFSNSESVESWAPSFSLSSCSILSMSCLLCSRCTTGQ